ncbi:hypothetical protein HYQ46_011156 [Verticillium longisporum]|nr:hypothetical protein HYQ46_011156 [Verticillium longisporum]
MAPAWCIKNLIELAQIEDPAVEREALVPQATVHIGARVSVGGQADGTVEAGPLAEGLIVDSRVAIASRAVHLAEAVGGGR